MIIHHMSDGSVRDSIEGFVIPKKFEEVYILANKKSKENQNGNSNKSRNIGEKQILDR